MKSTRSWRPRGHEDPFRSQGPPGCGGPRERGRITSSGHEIALDAGAREHAGTDADGALVDHQVAHVQVVGSSSRGRSEEHTSELQSRGQLVCRLLLEKKKTTTSSQMQW